jgi:hypothetical protein
MLRSPPSTKPSAAAISLFPIMILLIEWPKIRFENSFSSASRLDLLKILKCTHSKLRFTSGEFCSGFFIGKFRGAFQLFKTAAAVEIEYKRQIRLASE